MPLLRTLQSRWKLLPQQTERGQGVLFIIVKKGRAFLAVFSQERGKESRSWLYCMHRGANKPSGANKRLERKRSSFLLPPVFLLTSPSTLLPGGAQSTAETDLCSRLSRLIVFG